MTPLKTMPPETAEGAGRIAELVEMIERAEMNRDLQWREMDRHPVGSHAYRIAHIEGGYHDRVIDAARAELRAIIGVDPFRLASAIGVQ